MIRDGRFLDTPDRRDDGCRFYSSYDFDMYHDHRRYHHYRRNYMGYFQDEFKKEKPPTFNGEMKKSKDVEAWLLAMNKFFKMHDYLKNMKAKIATFSLKGKSNIWWEYLKNTRDIYEEEFTWSEFKRLFRKKHLSERYYDDKEKEFYELNMGSMTNEEYTSIFMELLRCVPYLKEEKAKIQRFINGLLVAFKNRIEFNQRISLEEVIRKLKHCYE